MNMSASENSRMTGNALYAEAMGEQRPKAKQVNFQQALMAYNKALRLATDDDERCSAVKNIGMSSWRLAQVSQNRVVCANPTETAAHYYVEALGHLSHCHRHKGQKKRLTENDVSWCSEVSSTVLILATEYVEWCESTHPLANRSKPLYKGLSAVGNNLQSVRCCLHLAILESEFRFAMTCSDDYRRALPHLRECNYHIEELLHFGSSKEQTEARVYKDDVVFNESTALAMQAIDKGDVALKSALLDNESLDMTAVYTALDDYHYAILMTKEISIEQECVAYSRLAHVYANVLKLPMRGGQFAKQCIELAMTMINTELYKKVWYVQAQEILRAYQELVSRRDEEAKSAKKAKIREELKKELEQLDRISKIDDCSEFLEELEKTFPPRRSSGEKLSKLKSYCGKLFVLYSPDKQIDNAEEKDEKWIVLCEEITKVLNAKYDQFCF